MGNLESKIKKFNVKEWIPFYGIYEVQNKLSRRKSPADKSGLLVINALYHGVVSFYPIIYMFDKIK